MQPLFSRALLSRAIFSLIAYAVFFAPLGLVFLLLTELVQQPRFSVDPLFTFLILLLPTYAWGWVPTLTAFMFGVIGSSVFIWFQRRKKLKHSLSFNQLVSAGVVLGACTGSVAMYLWQPSIQISLLAGAFPGACCGLICTLIALEQSDAATFSTRGFA
jgi:hypothetical protein